MTGFRQIPGGRFSYEWAFVITKSDDMPHAVARAHKLCAVEWCTHTFGPSAEFDTDSTWADPFDCIVFEDPHQAMMFKLSWC